MLKVSVYRYNPDQDKKPYLQHYDIDILPSDRMLVSRELTLSPTP